MADTPTDISGYRSAGNYVPGMGMGPAAAPSSILGSGTTGSLTLGGAPPMGVNSLVNSGSKTATAVAPPPEPPPAKQETTDFTPEQPTEQQVKPPVKKSKAQPESPQPPSPPSVAEENTPPPEVITDVIKDYDWTASINKQQLQDKIPYIRLKEFKITANNALNAIAAGVFAWSDMQKAGAGAVSKAAGAAGSLMDQVEFLKNIKDSKFAKVIADQAGVLGNGIESFVESISQAVGKMATPTDFGPEGQHLQDVYGGLYGRESTGRTYIFPYFDNDYFQASNDFTQETTIPFMKEAFEMVSAAANTLPALVEPGVYVQRPKFYKFDSGENQISFSITLYNTISPLAYLQNSKLVQQLIINNLPRRKTKVVVDPPCIYEVLIPGKVFYPYCFISDLRVLHVGTKRMLGDEIVPDAFEVQITIKSLTTDANNFYEKQMQHHEMTFPPPAQADVPDFGSSPDYNASTGNIPQQGDSAQQRDTIATPAGATGSIPVGSSGKVSPGDLQAYTEERIKNSKLNGYVPADAAKYGVDGSPKSWANFFNKLAAAESGYNVNSTNTNDPGGSYGLFQVAPADGKRYGANPTGQNWTTQQLRDPKINTDTAIAIFERNTMKSGRIESSGGKGAGGYFAAASMRKIARR